MQADAKTNITLGFTKDPSLLEQYYKIRGDMYALELGLDDFPREKDRHDDNSDILILEEDGKVVGGVRLVIKRPDSLLPMESKGFILEEILPELNLQNVTYGEFSRLAILPDYRENYLNTIIGMIGNKGREYNSKFLFAISPLAQSRMYRRFEKTFGFSLEVRDDLGQSEFANKWELHAALLIFREIEETHNVDS
jgi:hypothetical protein